ncbi:hypothetical protein [Enterococcus mundtii]|uniref:hypothetical protein n=1 Tax=Enterococcus mundtii TaxID=53346 RepID=UPI001964E9A9|nr:hypothetical protein [Enterococcus mundtii]
MSPIVSKWLFATFVSSLSVTAFVGLGSSDFAGFTAVFPNQSHAPQSVSTGKSVTVSAAPKETSNFDKSVNYSPLS